MMQDVIVCSYSRTIAGWLVHKFPGDVSLDSSGADNEAIISVLQLLLPAIEFEATTQGHFNLGDRIRQVSGLKRKKEQLAWLIDLFEQSPLPDTIKDELYGQLKVFVKWNVNAAQVAASYLHFPFAKKLFHGKFPKYIRAGKHVREKVDPPIRLSAQQKSLVLDTMKFSLALQYRETDPVTFADENELEFFDMGRGLQIALVGMQKHKRLSLESYIGYMAFKNGVPLAYGGGWIWGQRCRIGISIYPEFRKTGSSWLFTQVLRLYYQHFNVRHFIVRANQFGKGNHDGLRSGAFWFYYKLGFRPADYELKKLARSEWKKIRANKTYRSSLKTLRMFIAGPLEWRLAPASIPMVDAETISRKISDTINMDHGRSQITALRSVKNQVKEKLKPLNWPGQLKHSIRDLENWCLLINLLTGFQDWKTEDKKRLVELIQVKLTGKERDFIVAMQRFGLFWRSIFFCST
jgi:hypothetical protein